MSAGLARPPEEQLDRRVRRGANPATPATELDRLAHDPAATVRGAVALNPSTSAAVDLHLTADRDERVRTLLAHKVGTLLPHVRPDEAGQLDERTYAVLAALVRDEAERVRTIIAEVAAGLPDMPRDLLLLLAQDTAMPVSEPVLRLSPLLSTTDLLALLRAPPHAAANTAIARRAGLPAAVADAIAATTDSAAIRAMLANPSANIRERTLDQLVGRAATEPSWHDPLVRRPTLPDGAARALSEIVADHLIRVLSERQDLSPDTLAEIHHRLRAAIISVTGCVAAAEAPPDASLLAEARRQDAAGKLDEAALLASLRAGDRRRATAALAVAAGVPMAMVDHATALRSAKALVSLVWKAGFSMRVAGAVQSVLGELGPAGIIAAPPGGGFPLSREEMAWQLDFLGCRGR